MDTPIRLKQPSALRIARLEDRLTFLYLEFGNVHQDENGTAFEINSPTRGPQVVYLPVATLSALLLGPGTTLSQQAAATLARAGCVTLFTGAGMVRSYGAFLSPNAPTKLLLKQAQIMTDPERRETAARVMFTKRFPDASPAIQAGKRITITQLQALEGARMKAVYQTEARKHRLTRWRRNNGSDPSMGEPDPVNIALNYANVALYGVTNCVTLLLGLSPGLGIIHTGNRQSFVLDIADLYKTTLTIPAAFAVKDEPNPERAVMRHLRDRSRLIRLMPRIVDDIYEVLDEPTPSAGGEDWEINDLWLWSPDGQHQLDTFAKP